MDKTVLITGTSTGIGAACVARQAAAGWRVYAGVRKIEDGERLAASVEGDVVPVLLDVVNGDHIDSVLAQIESEVGRLNGLVNNAGIAVGGPIELLTDQEWRRQFDVNFFSVIALTRQAMPLVDKADGRFVHIGSIAGRVASGGVAPYAASKHAIEAFNWALRDELRLAGSKMKSSVIEPGEAKTQIWDKGADTVAELDARLVESGLKARHGKLIDVQRAFIEEGNSRGIEADKVAKAVEHALTARRPKPRYLVGPDALGVGIISRLPDRLTEAVMSMNMKRMAKAGAKLR